MSPASLNASTNASGSAIERHTCCGWLLLLGWPGVPDPAEGLAAVEELGAVFPAAAALTRWEAGAVHWAPQCPICTNKFPERLFHEKEAQTTEPRILCLAVVVRKTILLALR